MTTSPHNHPFYQPLWRRVAIVVSTALWAAFETFKVGDGFWTIVSLAVCAYCAWTFLITWKSPPDTPQ